MKNLNKNLTFYILILFCSVIGNVSANDYFVITNTMKKQEKAQEKAAVIGGWVLNTNLYSNLKPNLFAVVRGPYKSKEKANKALSWLLDGGRYKGSYIKNAGKTNIKINLKNNNLSPQVLTALFGELSIEATEEKGAENPCQPQEPYYNITISHIGIARVYNDKTGKVSMEPVRNEIDFGGFWKIKRTGEITRMRICAE